MHLLRVVIFGGFIASSVQAATLYWNPFGSYGGSANWDYDNTVYWYNGSTNLKWTDTTGADIAIFQGTGNSPPYTVTVVGNVTVNKLQFENGNYGGSGGITGGIITLAGAAPAIRAGDAGQYDTTINSTLAGVNGMILSLGNGNATTLHLGGSNTVTGGVNFTSSTGTVILGSPTALGTGNALTMSAYSSSYYAALDLNGNNQGIGALTGDAYSYIQNGLASTTATLTVNQAGSTTFAGTLRNNGGAGGTLALTKDGAGTLTLTNANTYSGGTTISAGTLQVGNGGTTGSLGTGNIVNNGTLAYNFGNTSAVSLPSGSGITGSGNLSATARDIKFNGAITLGGSQSFTQTGGGGLYQGLEVFANTTLTGSSVTLSGDVGKRDSSGNTLTIDTSASNGTVNLNVSTGRNGVWYGLAGFTVNAGSGTINVTGSGPASSGWASTVTLNGAVNIPSAVSYLGNGVFNGPITIAGNIARTGAVVFHATAASTISGSLGLSQSLTGYNTFNVDNGVTMTVSGQVNGVSGVSWGGINKQGPGTLSLTNATNSYGQGLQLNGGTVEFSNNALKARTSTDGPGYAADFQASSTLRWGTGNTTDISTGGQIKIGDGVTATFDTNGASPTFATAFTLGGSATGALTKAGAGTLTLSAANTYTGATTVNGGTLAYQNAYASPSHSIASGATLEFNVASGTADRAATTFSGAGTLKKTGAGTLQWGGTVATFNLSPGSMIDVQAGTFTGGSNANEVWTNNKADLNVASGATFDGVEAAIYVDALTGTGTIKSGYSGYPSTITFGVDNGSGTFNGVLADSAAAGNFTKAGSGTQVLANSNTYTGATVVNGGVLSLAANQTIKIGNTLTVNAGATVNLASAGDAVRDLATITLNGGTLADTSATASHNHAILLSTGRTLNMQNGASIIGTGAAAGHSQYGQIFLGYGGTTVNVTGTPASTWNADIRWGDASGATTINIATGSTLLVAGHLGHFEGSQWANLNLTGGGTLIMTDSTGNQSTPTIGAAATMQIGNGGTTGDFPNGAAGGSGGVTNNGTLSFNRSNTYTPIRIISGGGQVVQNGTGTVTLSQANTYTGGTVVNSGTLKAGITSVANTSGAFGNNSAVTMANASGATLDITGYNTQIGSLTGGGATGGNVTLGAATLTTGGNNTSPAAYAGTISGTGGVTKIGTGVQTFSGNNGYTGVTTVSAGVLKLDSAGALPGGIGVTGGTSALTFNGGVIGLAGGNFTRGLAAAGTVTGATFTGAGGWAAYGADRTVNLGGSGGTVVWGAANTGFNGQTLILGAASATNTVDLQNPLDLGSGARTVQVDDGAATADGILSGVLSGTGGLTKSGAGTLLLTNDNTFTGVLGVSGGSLSLTGASGAARTAGGVAVSGGGTLLLDNTVGNSDRLKDTGTVALTGGTLNFSHAAAAADYSETTGALAVSGSGNVIRTHRAATGQTSTLTFASLAYTAGTLQFYGEGLGLSDGRNRIFIGGTVPLTGGVIGGNAVYFDGVNTGQAGYSLANGVALYAPTASIDVRGGVIPDLDTSIGIVESGSGANITLISPVITIQSLTQNASSAGTVDLAGGTLRVGNVLVGNASAALTLGVTPNSGSITPGIAGGTLSLNNNYATPLTVNAVIANNVSASGLNKTGTGTVLLAGASTYTGGTVVQEGTLQLGAANSLPTGTLLTLGGGTTSGILKLAGNSQSLGGLTTAGSGLDNRVVNGSSTPATLTLGGGSVYEGLLGGPGANENNLSITASGSPTLTGLNTFTGNVTVGTGATLVVPVIAVSGPQPLGQGASAITFQGNASLGSTLQYSGTGAGATNRGLAMAGGQGGTVNVSSATGVLTVNGPLTGDYAFAKSGPGTLVLTGSEDWNSSGGVLGGTLVIGGLAGAGNNSLTGGNWDVHSGATLRVNTTGVFESSTLTRDGTFNLESGTLRTNAIAGTGAFVWGNATLATLGNLAEGAVDRTDPAGAPSGPVVKEGNILDFAGNLASSVASGQISTLDLGPAVQNDGLRYNQLKVTGALSLAGVDTLRFSINPYLLRPTSPNSVTTGDWGTLRLVMADSITGTFDNITGIGSDSIGWSVFSGSFTGAADLPLNSYYIEYVAAGITDEGIQAGAAILFHYKVAGSVPEPASAGLAAAGVLLLRVLARRPRKTQRRVRLRLRFRSPE